MRLKNHYCSKSTLKYVKDVSQIASLDYESEDHRKIRDEAMEMVNICKEKLSFSSINTISILKQYDAMLESKQQELSRHLKEISHRNDKPDSQRLVPQNIFVPDLSTTAINEDDVIEDDDDGAPFRILLRSTSQVICELSVKKSTEKKPKEGYEPASKKGEPVEQNKGSRRASSEQVTTDSRKPKLTKEVLPEKYDEKRLGDIRTPKKLEEVGPSDAFKKRQPENLPLAHYLSYVIWLTKLDSELSYDELTISKYVFSKVQDVDDSEPLFDGCGDKEATRASMVTLRPGEQLEMNVINIWSTILNDQRAKGISPLQADTSRHAIKVQVPQTQLIAQ
ncbi:hypothetical protein Cgig2_015294 [Carnegiea gigantea]|uniref:Uncharacterized protein n=1 Tax=Carnegiea gigantea TaxID=171969 RepID=A0A9Q1GIU2_9CARY|nr:hypothetical protein Cgig2_015294 [Carnegiea gigantea]